VLFKNKYSSVFFLGTEHTDHYEGIYKKHQQRQDGLVSNAMSGFVATNKKHPYINKQTL